MSHVYHTECLYTVVKNTSGAARNFPFLPPHGVRLAANATYSMAGDPISAVARGDRKANARHVNDFIAAIADHSLAVVSTPAPVLKDLGNSQTKVVVVNNGTLASADPCWATSIS